MWLVVLSDQLPVNALVGRYPTNKLIGREPILKRITALASFPKEMATCGINSPFGELSPTSGQVAHVLLTRAPLKFLSIATKKSPLDLHVLSTPPAFVLSQNQTLRKIFCPESRSTERQRLSVPG